MTKEEQIKKQADIYTDGASNYVVWSDNGVWTDKNDIELVEKTFIDDAKYADKHPDLNGKELLYVVHKTAERTKKEFLIKACDYLYKLNQMNLNEYGKNCPLVNVCDFCKAMEE